MIDAFKRDAKALLKKYASLKAELAELQQQLLDNPRMGTLIHENVYKIRLAVKSKGRGKSGGVRVISYIVEIEVQVENNELEDDVSIYLLSIYDKSDFDNLSDVYLKDLVEEINKELDNEA